MHHLHNWDGHAFFLIKYEMLALSVIYSGLTLIVQLIDLRHTRPWVIVWIQKKCWMQLQFQLSDFSPKWNKRKWEFLCWITTSGTEVSVKWTIKACLETVSSHNDRGTWSNNGDLLISSNPHAWGRPLLTLLDVEFIAAFPSYSNILLAKLVQLFVCSTLS